MKKASFFPFILEPVVAVKSQSKQVSASRRNNIFYIFFDTIQNLFYNEFIKFIFGFVLHGQIFFLANGFLYYPQCCWTTCWSLEDSGSLKGIQ